ncbi:hypothetical protein DZF95_14350, partial [Clavibacter michiganensis]
MSDTHDDGRPDADQARARAAGDGPAYAPSSASDTAYPDGSYPGAAYPGGPYPAGPYPATHPGAVPPPGYGLALLPHALRPLP